MKDEPGAHVSNSDPRDRGPRETAASTDLYLELLKRALLGLLSLRTVEPALRGMGPGALRWALQKLEPRLKAGQRSSCEGC
jgi:hypothetical protein